MKSTFLCIIGILSLAGLMVGCTMLEPIQPDTIVKHPLGTEPISLGMTKNQVRDVLGEPDLIQDKGQSDGKGLTQKEEWVYHKRAKNLPLNFGYLSKSLRLNFDGNNLTSYQEE